MQLIEDASAQKLRGAYYTPPAIASFILHWGINGSQVVVMVSFWSRWQQNTCCSIMLQLLNTKP